VNLKHIKSVTAESDVTELAVDNCFTAEYSHYRVYLNNLNSYGATYYHANLRDNSGVKTGTNYIQQGLQKFGNTGSGGGQGFYYTGYINSLDYIIYFAGQGINSYQNTIHGVYDFYMPFESDKYTFMTGKAVTSQGEYQIFTSETNFVYPDACSITGFQMSSGANKIYTGTKFSVYGVPV